LETGGGNTIQGNFIGTNAAGDTALANGTGISVESINNVIGGATPAARNVVLGGNNQAIPVGVFNTAASGNTIQGNYIGTNAAGTAGLGSLRGTYFGSANNLLGGTAVGAGNLIAGGSGIDAVTVQDANGNTIQGNLIGVSADGTTSLGNLNGGIQVTRADGTTIGGDDDDDGALDGIVRARNVIVAASGVGISGNSSVGQLAGTGNLVQGNYIGTNAAGTASLQPVGGAAGTGIVANQSQNNRIGGTTAGAGNVVAGHHTGVRLFSSDGAAGQATGNIVQGNFIGTN